MTPGSDRRLSSEQTLLTTELQPHAPHNYSFAQRGTDGPAPGRERIAPSSRPPFEHPCPSCHDSGVYADWQLGPGGWHEYRRLCNCLELA
jgi:hypothetical protein